MAFATAGVAFGAAALLIAISFASSSPGSDHAGREVAPKVTLTANTDFLITSAVSSSSSCDNVALFLPGAKDYICYTVHNPYTLPFSVESISIDKTTAPINCPVSNLDLSATTYSGSPALTVAAHGTGVVAEPISMIASATNQDACLGATFEFSNAGTAKVTTPTPPSTSTTTTTESTETPAGTATTTTTAPGTRTTEPPTSPLASTGADIAGVGGAGVLAFGVGALLVLASKRRRRKALEEAGEGPAQ